MPATASARPAASVFRKAASAAAARSCRSMRLYPARPDPCQRRSKCRTAPNLRIARSSKGRKGRFRSARDAALRWVRYRLSREIVYGAALPGAGPRATGTWTRRCRGHAGRAAGAALRTHWLPRPRRTAGDASTWPDEMVTGLSARFSVSNSRSQPLCHNCRPSVDHALPLYLRYANGARFCRPLRIVPP
jgi:hypothetical protein